MLYFKWISQTNFHLHFPSNYSTTVNHWLQKRTEKRLNIWLNVVSYNSSFPFLNGCQHGGDHNWEVQAVDKDLLAAWHNSWKEQYMFWRRKAHQDLKWCYIEAHQEDSKMFLTEMCVLRWKCGTGCNFKPPPLKAKNIDSAFFSKEKPFKPAKHVYRNMECHCLLWGLSTNMASRGPYHTFPIQPPCLPPGTIWKYFSREKCNGQLQFHQQAWEYLVTGHLSQETIHPIYPFLLPGNITGNTKFICQHTVPMQNQCPPTDMLCKNKLQGLPA